MENKIKSAPEGALLIEEAAEILCCSTGTVRNRMFSGELRFIQPFRKGKRYPLKEDVLNALTPVLDQSINSIQESVSAIQKKRTACRAFLIAQGGLKEKNGNYLKVKNRRRKK